MTGLEKIGLNLSYSYAFFIPGVVICFLYAYYVYRFTLPLVSSSKRFFLALLRGSALMILLLIFFEPILSITRKSISEPVNMIFVDNSRSMQIDDGTDRVNSVKNILNVLSNETQPVSNSLYSFGNKIRKVDSDSIDTFDFMESSTNLAGIFNSAVLSEQNISSITIISDGVITDGINPIYSAIQKAIPLYTVGVGDSARKNDLEIKTVLYNDLIYAETPTTILAAVTSRGYAGEKMTLSLFENSIPVDQKSLTIDASGTNNVTFEYTPLSGGEKKLTITVSELPEEFTYANNKKVFYVNVLSNKIKALLLSGSPSADLTFIKNSLESDRNISVSTLTQIRNEQFLEGDFQNKIDSADIFFLLGFPTRESSIAVLNRLKDKIEDQNTPFFISISASTDAAKLDIFRQHLPFTISTIGEMYNLVQPEIQIGERNNPLLANNSNDPIAAWNTLPPVLQPAMQMNAKPESKVLSSIRTENASKPQPLLITRSVSNSRSIALLAKDFWRWKLQTASRKSDLFDSFILNSVRWLNVSEEFRKIKISPVKKVFAAGEEIEFSARVYDDAMNPVSNSEVKIDIFMNQERFEINLNSVGSGLYEGSLQIRNPGDYSYKGEARLNGSLLGSDEGSFNIGDIDLELLNPRMNFEFLNQLASETGGKYFDQKNIDGLLKELNRISETAKKEKLITSEISLWSNEWMLILAILIFALEWFIRKRSGML